MDKPIYLGFAVLEFSNFLLCETCYKNIQSCFGQENIQLQYTDTDSFVLSMKTKKTIKGLKKLDCMYDFSNLDEKHDIFSKKEEKVIGKYKIENPKNFWFDEFVCLRSMVFSFKCGDEINNKSKGISESGTKHVKFEEDKKCIDGKEYQRESNN